MTNEIHGRLQSVLREVFDDPELTVADATTADQIDGWDSLMHVNIIIAVEQRFRVKFAAAEIAGLKDKGQNIGTFKQALAKKLATR